MRTHIRHVRQTRSVQRLLVAGLAVPLLALTACGGGDGDSGGGAKDGGKQESAQEGGADSGGESGGDSGDSGDSGGEGGDSGGADSGVRALTEAELKSALLTEKDLPGYVATSAVQMDPTEDAVTADRGECVPISDGMSSEPEYARTASATGSLLKGDSATGGELHAVQLSAYAEGDAEKWLGELRTALKECDGFSQAGGGPAFEVAPVEAGEPVGDGSVAFKLAGAGAVNMDIMVTVVRTGDNTASYFYYGGEGKLQPMERKVAVAGHEKLVEVAKG